jgi:prevent-host-death family protein
MITINIHDAKTHLSHYLEEVAKGETVVICKRNRPLAEIRSLPTPPATPRPIGLAKGTFSIPATFFEPLPDDVTRDFEGHDSL